MATAFVEGAAHNARDGRLRGASELWTDCVTRPPRPVCAELAFVPGAAGRVAEAMEPTVELAHGGVWQLGSQFSGFATQLAQKA